MVGDEDEIILIQEESAADAHRGFEVVDLSSSDLASAQVTVSSQSLDFLCTTAGTQQVLDRRRLRDQIQQVK